VGDAGFQRKCELELFGKRSERAFVIASHDLGFLKTTCTRALVLDSGRAKLFDDIDLAVDIYAAIASRSASLEAA
jgi:capsular polysaccharide transport system ATP-binding protein